MRAKGWMRLAVGLSVIWMIGRTVFIANWLVDDATRYAESLRSLCELGNKSLVRDFPVDGPRHMRDCGAEWQKHYEIGLDPFLKIYGRFGAAVYALAVLLLGWVLGGLTFLIVWWTRRGFKRSGRAGWYRVGIVASVFWVVGGGIWGNTVGIAKARWVVAAYSDCLEQRSIQPHGSVPSDTDWTPCTFGLTGTTKPLSPIIGTMRRCSDCFQFSLVGSLYRWSIIRAEFAMCAQTAQPESKPD